MITENRVGVPVDGMHTHHSSLCWSAIFAGGFIGVGLGFLLHLFGIAIGLSAYSATPDGATAVTIGGFLGLLIGVVASMGAAGYVAGYLGRFHQCYCHGGIIYGFVTWSMALVLSAALVIPLTHYMSYYKNNLIPKTIVMQQSEPNETSVVKTNDPVKAVANKTIGPVTSTDLAWSGWIIFILFFIGAIASCLGASCGMCCRKHQVVTTVTPVIP